MATIHPTSLVDSKAELGSDVEVGPYCIIDGPAIIGPGCRLVGQCYISGKVVMGASNTLYPGARIGFEPQHRDFAGKSSGLVIGDNNQFREGVTVHRSMTEEGHPTTIGSDNLLMTNAHVGHDAIIGSKVVLTSGSLIGGHAQLFDQVIFGGNAALHQFCKVGRMSFVGGLAGITKDLPPFLIAAGTNSVTSINAVGLRRAGYERAAIDAVKQAYDVVYRSGHTNPTAVTKLEEFAESSEAGADLIREIADFIRTSERGLAAHSLQAGTHKIQR